MTAPIWTPSPQCAASANITEFIRRINQRHDLELTDYDGLHRFSVDAPDRFWGEVWDFCSVQAETRGERVVENIGRMPGARWFPQARLNFARNLLRRRDSEPALIALREDGSRVTVSFGELYDRVSCMAQALGAAGVGVGDRVAGYLPNTPDAIAAMLATTSRGAIWTCCAPEYGAAAAVERIGQVAPSVLFAADGYCYGGKTFDLLPRVREIEARVPSIKRTFILPVLSAETADSRALAKFTPAQIEFESLPFEHPAFILFSSGTSGAPKCVVHSAGGALLENLKSHVLQFDVKPGDRIYMPCTAGWVVWNIMSVALGCGATLVLYDGSPYLPNADQLVRHAAQERVTFVRWPARYVESLAKSGVEPIEHYDFSELRTVMCNGSVFGASGYEYIYERVKHDVHLVSPSGGTDSCGSLLSSNPIGPVWAGEIQAFALGFKVDVFDESGCPLRGEPGELVVTQGFPSMPVGFWNDPDGNRFREAYFSRFSNVWRHGDWAQITERKGIIVQGRSDFTLNARGIRVGPAEIYRQVEPFADVAECAAVAQEWQGDSRVILFVRLREGSEWTEELAEAIRASIRGKLSPRHVPARIIAVPDLPVTVTGKVSESAIHHAIHERDVPNRSSLANPQALTWFAPARLPELYR
jgi:acetoacetyl-CoA synthetase